MSIQGFARNVVERVVAIHTSWDGDVEHANALINGSEPRDRLVLNEFRTVQPVVCMPNVVALACDAKLVNPCDLRRALAQVGRFDQRRFLDPAGEGVLVHGARATVGRGACVVHAERIDRHHAVVSGTKPSGWKGVCEGLDVLSHRTNKRHVWIFNGGEAVSRHVNLVGFADFTERVFPIDPRNGSAVVDVALEVRADAYW